VPIDRSIGAAYADRIITLYVEVERELATLIASKLKRGVAHDDLTQKMLALSEIRRSAEAAMRKIDGKTGPAVELALREAAAAGGRKAQEELLRVRDRRAVGRRLADVDKNLVNSPSILRLAASLAPALERKLQATHLQVVRSAGDIYQHAVAAMSAPGVLAGVSTRREASQKALDHLWRKGITGFVDKAGKNWNLAGYVEMATRTTTAHAAIQAHLDQLGQQGMDLVMVSADGAPCPICRPWEGKILTTGSASGAQTIERASELDGSAVKVHIDGSTSEAIAAGLFHPSCRHRFITYLPGLTAPIETAGEGSALYRAEQQQRGLERQARRLAVQQAGAVDPDAAKRYAAAYRAKRAEIKAHVDDHSGLRRKTERERIDLGHAPSAAPTPLRKTMPAPEERSIPVVDATAPGVQKYQELGLYVNEELRGTAASKMQRIPRETADSIIEDLDRTFREAGPTHGTNVVYRGLNEPESLKTMQERALFGDESAVGKEFTDKAYGSTTDSAGAAESFAGFGSGKTIVKITLPPGSSAIKLKGNLERESEVLLNRGYTLKITKDDMATGADGVRRMEAILVPSRTAPVKTPAAPSTGPKSIRKPGTDQEKWIKDFANLNAVVDRKARTKQGDGALDAIGERQGFKAKPQNVTKAQLDEAIRHGWVETWRGVNPGMAEFEVTINSRQINDQLRHGDFFPGLGIYGNGTYLSVHRGVAEVYAGVREEMAEPGGYIRLAVDPGARIINHSDLIAERDAWIAAQGPYMDSVLKRIVADEGRYAAIRGYDVIRVVNKEDGSDLADEKDRHYDQYIILNRSVIMIQDTDPT
jgi:hypothetical protein